MASHILWQGFLRRGTSKRGIARLKGVLRDNIHSPRCLLSKSRVNSRANQRDLIDEQSRVVTCERSLPQSGVRVNMWCKE